MPGEVGKGHAWLAEPDPPRRRRWRVDNTCMPCRVVHMAPGLPASSARGPPKPPPAAPPKPHTPPPHHSTCMAPIQLASEVECTSSYHRHVPRGRHERTSHLQSATLSVPSWQMT
eukprot:scaffold4498_cov119-Isochrysis_galbana.AAC.54